MKLKIFALALFIGFFASCEKESNSTDSVSSPGNGTGGSLARFTIVGNYLYVANTNTLDVLDLTNPAHPQQKESIPLGWPVETIFPFDNNLFIGTSSGLYIFSLANPAKPEQLGQAQHFRSCDPVVANDSMAFVTLRGDTRCGPAVDGLYVHDIKDVNNPTLIKTFEMPTPSGLALNGRYLYVCQRDNGLSVIDVKNPANPTIIKQITDGYYNDAIVYKNLLVCYVSTGIKLLDISTPENPVYLSIVQN